VADDYRHVLDLLVFFLGNSKCCLLVPTFVFPEVLVLLSGVADVYTWYVTCVLPWCFSPLHCAG
jgi:hypothetical protein